MYNQQILEKLSERFDEENLIKATEIISLMYDIKYQACISDEGLCSEYNYERDWWLEASQKLTNKNEIDRLIK